MEAFKSCFNLIFSSAQLIFAHLSVVRFLGISLLNILLTAFFITLLFNSFSRVGGSSVGDFAGSASKSIGNQARSERARREQAYNRQRARDIQASRTVTRDRKRWKEK